MGGREAADGNGSVIPVSVVEKELVVGSGLTTFQLEGIKSYIFGFSLFKMC